MTYYSNHCLSCVCLTHFERLPVEDHSSIVTDVQRPHVKSRHLRVPVQILMDLQYRYITRKCSSTLHRSDRFSVSDEII